MKVLLSLLSLSMLIFASLWTLVRQTLAGPIPKRLAQLALLLGLMILLMGGCISSAQAAYAPVYGPTHLIELTFQKEADLWVYQAQDQLSDMDGRLWDVKVAKSMEPGIEGVYLWLITRSPQVQLDAAQPLQLILNSAQQLKATNVTAQFFRGELPAHNLGQYDIQAVLPQLEQARSLQLQIPTTNDQPITLSVPSETVSEWATVGGCNYLLCGD